MIDELTKQLRMSLAIANAKKIDDIPMQSMTLSLDIDQMQRAAKPRRHPDVSVWCDEDHDEPFITLCIEPKHTQPARMIDLLPNEARQLANLLTVLAAKIEELSNGSDEKTA